MMQPPDLVTSPPANLALRQALAQFTTGVAIVTSRSADNAPVGITINSFSSVSLDPPLVLWSVSRQANSFKIFRNCQRYLIHILAANQLDLAKRFATRGADRFSPQSETAWRYTNTQLPQLDNCLAWFECLNRSQYEEGDHVILVGQVTAFCNASGPPLAFHGGQYFTSFIETPLPQALSSPWVSALSQTPPPHNAAAKKSSAARPKRPKRPAPPAAD